MPLSYLFEQSRVRISGGPLYINVTKCQHSALAVSSSDEQDRYVVTKLCKNMAAFIGVTLSGEPIQFPTIRCHSNMS